MWDRFKTWLLNPEGLTPHGFCLTWEPSYVWLNLLGDIGISIAYTTIPITIGYILWKRRQSFRHPVLAAMFAGFIFSCGFTHMLEALAIWYPIYGLLGVMKVATASISAVTAVVLARLAPAIAMLPTPDELLEADQRSLNILNRTGMLLAAENNLDRIVQSTTDSARELSNAAYAAFFYSNAGPEGSEMTLVTVSGTEREAFTKFGYPRPTAIFAPTLLHNQIVRSDDITLDPRYGQNSPNKGLPPGHPPIRSYLSVPVVSRGGTVLGALFFGHPKAGMFNKRSEDIITGIASQAAIAIDNFRLYATLEEKVAQRTAELQAAYATLSKNEEQYRAMFNRSPVPMYSLNSEGCIQLVSQSWLELMQYSREEIVGTHISDYYCKPYERSHFDAMWQKLLADGQNYNYEVTMCRQDGKTFDVLISAVVIYDVSDGEPRFTHTMSVAIDITERKQIEKARIQAEKLAVVGQLAGGTAHDFNNIAMAFESATRVLDRHYGKVLRADEKGNTLLDNMRDTARRGRDICQRLLAFSRRSELKTEKVAPADILGNVRAAVIASFGMSGVSVEIGEALDLPLINTDRSQLEVVLLNMVINARDAMPQGGTITMTAREAQIGPGDSLAAGRYVLFTIIDTGIGMDAETASKALEPFFTTKPEGKGTGLGLSMAYEFAKKSGGDLRIESAPGKGTTILIWVSAVND